MHAAPIASEADAAAFLRGVADASANHNCWAWRLAQQYRFSDDGEPSGSAGKPILTAIDGQGLDQVMVVVTRWFGGIKLGVGGLMRAYGGSTAECLRQAHQVEVVDLVDANFELGYAELELFKARTQEWHAQILREDYGAEGVRVSMQVARVRLDELQQLLGDLSRGQAHLQLC